MLLENIVEIFDENKINEELDVIADKLSLFEKVNIEPIKGEASYDELMNLMGDAILKFTAARKGIGIANKLSNPKERQKHRSAIMGNLNRLRGLMARIDKAMAKVGGSEKVNEAWKESDYDDFYAQIKSGKLRRPTGRSDEDMMRHQYKERIQKERRSQRQQKTKNVNEAAKPKGNKDPESSFKQFDAMAQKVWATKDVEGKKAELKKMVGAFKYKDKQQKFYNKIEAETNANKLDKLAADLMQVGHGNAVIK